MKKFLKRVLIVFYLSILPIYAVADAGIIPTRIVKKLTVEELSNNVGDAISDYCAAIKDAKKKGLELPANTKELLDSPLSCTLEALKYMIPITKN